MRRATLAFVIVALLLPACDGPAEFSAPLGPPGAAPYDARLIGIWHWNSTPLTPAALVLMDGEAGFLEGTLSFMKIEPGAEGGAGLLWVNRTAHASVIDGETYYNTRLIDGALVSKEVGRPIESEGGNLFVPHPERGYWIVRAEIDEADRLTLHVLSEMMPQERNLASYRVECGEACAFTVFDLSPEQLTELIRAADPAELFDIELGPFVRVAGPEVPRPQ